MKNFIKLLIILIVSLISFSCTSNDENLREEINNDTYTIKITYQNMLSGFDRIKFEGLPIQEQNNKWMPVSGNDNHRNGIRYDEINNQINFFNHWDSDNNSINIEYLRHFNGDNYISINSEKYDLYNVIIPNPIINRFDITIPEEANKPPYYATNGIDIHFYEHLVDMEDYTQLDDFEDTFSFELEVKLK